MTIKGGISEWDKFIKLDIMLHMALARIARNPVHVFVLETVHQNISPYYDRFLPKKEEIMRENYYDLREIVAAVENGRAKKARLQAKKHVNRNFNFMEYKQPQGKL